ncbi:hypothetical protein D3C85_1923050 [compost metagenome]
MAVKGSRQHRFLEIGQRAAIAIRLANVTHSGRPPKTIASIDAIIKNEEEQEVIVVFHLVIRFCL